MKLIMENWRLFLERTKIKIEDPAEIQTFDFPKHHISGSALDQGGDIHLGPTYDQVNKDLDFLQTKPEKPETSLPRTDSRPGQGVPYQIPDGPTQPPENSRYYTVLELYGIAKKNAPSHAKEEDIKMMAAIAMAESGGKPRNIFGCKNPRKNPKYSKAARVAAKEEDIRNKSKGQPLERAYIKNNPMYFGKGSGCRFGDNSLGLWQINMINPKTAGKNIKKYGLNSADDLFNPDINAKVAWSYWTQRGFKPWATWLRRNSKRSDRVNPALKELEYLLKGNV